jgi:alpha-glucosidase
MLIAPAPSPEDVSPYEVHLPAGVWYDYWTGEAVDRRDKLEAHDLEQRDAANPVKPLVITPKLSELPVYVRAGAILPIAPLTQSTAEQPDGPLTLRVYVGDNCKGSVYTDDGNSFDYRKGAYLRRSIACEQQPDGSLNISLPKPEGSYKPWWKEIRFEVVGWTPTARQAITAQGVLPLLPSGKMWTFTIHETRLAANLTLR